MIEVVRTDVRFLLVKGPWQQCGEPTAAGEGCKTSLEDVAVPSEGMVTLQKVIWFVGCVLKVKPRGFIGGLDVNLEDTWYVSRKPGRSFPELSDDWQYRLQGLKRRKARPLPPALSVKHIKYLGPLPLSVLYSVLVTLSLSTHSLLSLSSWEASLSA